MAKPTGKKNGRPLVACEDLVDNWEELVYEGYSVGMSDVEVRKLLARPGYRILGHSTWDRLMQDEWFSATIKKGRLICEAWWEEQGRKGLCHPKFNTALWFIFMKNKFKWKDKQPEEVSHTYNQTTLSDPTQILEVLEKLGKKP